MDFFSQIEISKGKDECVVLLPGYTGGAGAFKSILQLLDSDIISSEYPGHGSDYKSFPNTDGDDWLDGAFDLVSSLREKYRRITLCGYSMGGAIAILISQKIKVDRLILFAPALVSHEVKRVDSRPVDMDSINPRLRTMCDDEDLEIIKYYLEHDDSVMQTRFEKIVSKARSCDKLDIPVFAFIGKKDPVETYDEEFYMCNKFGFNTFSFDDSTHAILYDDNHQTVVNQVKELL